MKNYILTFFVLLTFQNIQTDKLMASNSVLQSHSVSHKYRRITEVEAININSPVGTVPKLPYMVYVGYSDGTKEFRQTRWSNSSRFSEEMQADTIQNPIGSSYTVQGYIIGDNTTPNGYPITAKVSVITKETSSKKNLVADVFPLQNVEIVGKNRLVHNRNLAVEEIVGWDVTQQLYNYRDTYGLPTDGYKISDGWDSPTTKLKGHGSGHYMSALAFAFVSTKDENQKDILRNNMSRMVNELRECQERTFVWNEKLGRYWEARDFAPEAELREMKGTWADFDKHKKEWAKYGYGYINAIPAHHVVLVEMYRAYNNEEWIWAPYYSVHKQLAGLIDIANNIDDEDIAKKALLIAKDMGLWIWNRLYYRTFVETEGTQEERRAKSGNRYEMWNTYIAGEDGGTGESLSRLAEMIDDSEEKEKLLMAATFFDSPAFYDPLVRNIDDIRTRHANQHIPKITSALRSYRSNHNSYYYDLAENFWNLIQGRYRYSTGGVGNGEMFRQPYSQIMSMATNFVTDRDKNRYLSPTINETCCAYNLAKLTKDLNCFNPDDAKYMDYYERILYNQIVGSLNHVCYQTTYQYAVGLNASKPWGNSTPQSTCCGGTGSENHVKYQEAVYFASDNTLWVGLYMPTKLNWEEKNVLIEQECEWPAEKSKLFLQNGNNSFELKLRVPYWVTTDFDIKLNGKSIAEEYRPSSYVSIPYREWTTLDTVEIIMPFAAHIDFGPDKLDISSVDYFKTETSFEPSWVGTIMYGPLAMVTNDIDNWAEAQVDLETNLSNIEVLPLEYGNDISQNNLYALSIGNFKFQPDYNLHENSTHYLRINYKNESNQKIKAGLLSSLRHAQIYKVENYSKKSYGKLSKAVDYGVKLYNEDGDDIEQISKAIKNIENSISKLKSKKLDRRELLTLLYEANSKKSKDYTWDTYDKLVTAIAHSEEIIVAETTQNSIDKQVYLLQSAINNLVDIYSVEKTTLSESIQLAESRKNIQEKWNLLTIKIPEYPPWAINGYKKLINQLNKSLDVYNNKGKNFTQTEVDNSVAELNFIINSMRPGNLPELEDLDELLILINEVKTKEQNILNEDKLKFKESIEYSEMVVEYVMEGSGTHDMILKAKSELKLFL